LLLLATSAVVVADITCFAPVSRLHGAEASNASSDTAASIGALPAFACDTSAVALSNADLSLIPGAESWRRLISTDCTVVGVQASHRAAFDEVALSVVPLAVLDVDATAAAGLS
jgi:hypothetical protein